MEERFRTFTVLITKLYRAIRKIKNEETEEYGLSNPHVSCLYYLYKQEKLTLKELVDICLEDKAILSKATRTGHFVFDIAGNAGYHSSCCLYAG